MTWFLRSVGDHDTHRGALTGGQVVALCGVRFEPLTVGFGGKALPGQPADPDQICSECLRKVDGR